LIPLIKQHVSIPVIAAGGIGSGNAMAAAFCLGAEGVQVGSRFAATKESSAHENFKNAIVDAGDGDTQLTLKEVTPVRLIKNQFYLEVQKAYAEGASPEKLNELLGRGRAKKGMFLGDLNEGELEIGQVSSMISSIKTAKEVVDEMVLEFKSAVNVLNLKREFS
jgi:enoyl-[acyl-carrier protein] reductase II